MASEEEGGGCARVGKGVVGLPGEWNAEGAQRFVEGLVSPEAPAGKKFALDSKEPAGGYRDFLMNEARYASLTTAFPERAKELFAENEEAAMERYKHLLKLKKLYDEA